MVHGSWTEIRNFDPRGLDSVLCVMFQSHQKKARNAGGGGGVEKLDITGYVLYQIRMVQQMLTGKKFRRRPTERVGFFLPPSRNGKQLQAASVCA